MTAVEEKIYMPDHVLFEQKGPVAIVTINRPERMNALGTDVRQGLIDAFLKVRHEPSIRVAIVTGAGDKAFSAGADLKERNEIFKKKPYRVGPGCQRLLGHRFALCRGVFRRQRTIRATEPPQPFRALVATRGRRRPMPKAASSTPMRRPRRSPAR